MTKPSIYHKQGYTCAEAIIKAYNEEFNDNIPVSIGSGMGTGMTVGSVCGAVSAGVVVIGYLKGRNSNLEANEARKYSRELMNKVRERYNTEICKELKGKRISCAEIIDFTYEEMKKILFNQ